MVSLWLATTAFGQAVTDGEIPSLNAQRFRPTIDGERTLWVDDARDAWRDNEVTARLLLSYTDEPLVYTNDGGDVFGLVTSVTQADLMAGYSYGPARLGVHLPVYLLSTSTEVADETGLGDIGLDGRVVTPEDLLPLDLGASLRLTLPTATVANALGEPNLGWELAAIVSKELGPVLLAANVGTSGGPPIELENITLNDAFLFRASAGYAITEDAGAAIELTGDLPYSAPLSNFAGWPVEWLLSGYGYPAQDIVVRGGFGSGITTGIGAPDFRILLGVGFEPRPAKGPFDTDGDGLVNDVDSCPMEPEDFDSFDDEDGCPDPDNDKDGILDAADACISVAEDADGFEDADGCPEPTQVTLTVSDAVSSKALDIAKTQVSGDDVKKVGTSPLTVELPAGDYTGVAHAPAYEAGTIEMVVIDGPPQTFDLALTPQEAAQVVVTRERIELKDTINFETNKAVIKDNSYDLLDQAVKILVDYPEIKQLRIEGHTDSRGAEAYNLDLSNRRAASVLAYFVEQGVDTDRLNSVGYGETRPLDGAYNAAAWAVNRRVDFFIERWEESARVEQAE